jgi:hypothetical protein
MECVMRAVALLAAVGIWASCGSRASLDRSRDSRAATDLALQNNGGVAGSAAPPSSSDGEVDDLPVYQAGDATFDPDASGINEDALRHPPAPAPYDSMPERRIGGMGDLNDGGACSSDRYWLFPDEGFSSFCGDIADACSFVCGTPSGCREMAIHGGPQILYCPTHSG